jgi:hypothetical protein
MGAVQVLTCLECMHEAHEGECFATVGLEEGTVEGLRKFVEKKMATAFVRICPECNTPFYKTEVEAQTCCPLALILH